MKIHFTHSNTRAAFLKFTVKVFVLAASLLFICLDDTYATAWTTGTAGDVTVLSNWTNGTTSPTSFTTPGDTWTINLAMTMTTSENWTVGTSAGTPSPVTFATGGSVNNSISAGGTSTINIYGDLIMTGGTFTLGGTGTSNVVNIYGNVTFSSGTISSTGATSLFNINIYGNYTMSGGSVNTAGSASGTVTTNVNGNFAMSGGVYTSAGSSTIITNNIYGNCSFSGTSAMTCTGSSATSIVHLSLPTASGTMLADNTSTGAWSKTNIYIDAGCTAQLDGNFSVATGGAVVTTSGSFGLTVNGTLICPASYDVYGAGLFKLNAGATLEVANALGINGAIISTPAASSTFNTAANYLFNGTVAQVTGTKLPATLVAPDTITINNGAGVTLTNTTSTTGTLLFTNGILYTGTNTMTTDGAASAVVGAGANNYVDGTLIKNISGYSSVHYEVGDLDYAPMNLAFSAAGTGGGLGVMTTNGLHPMVATSGLQTTNMVNHYWTITDYSSSGPVTVTPAATYNAGDILGGSNATFVTQEYSGSAWLGSALTSTNTSAPYSTTPNSGIALSSLPGDYIFGSGCNTGAITGTPTVCLSSSTHLSDATTGGVWSSSNTGIATVDAFGVVYGVATGTATISYTVGCPAILLVSVGTQPITGITTLCSGSTTQLSDATGGGVWTSSNTSVATVSGSGLVYGVSGGSVNIIYTSGGCPSVSAPVTVVSLPGIIPATATVCNGSVVSLSDATGGGAWSSSNNSIATVSLSGVVTGAGPGNTTIIYTSGSCSTSATITVSGAISPITGTPTTFCAGSATNLSDATPGGTWSSSNTIVATVNNSGNVQGVGAGSANISYAAGGCSITIPITIDGPGGGSITGRDSVCIGSLHAMNLSDGITGGAWSSSNTARATVDPATGVVTGVSTGRDTIRYIVTNACGTYTVTYAIYVRTATQCATGINEATEGHAAELNLFPNPNSGTFTMQLLSATDEDVHVIITNIVGEKVREFVTTTNKAVEIRLDPAAGIYLLSGSTAHGSYMAKVVVD